MLSGEQTQQLVGQLHDLEAWAQPFLGKFDRPNHQNKPNIYGEIGGLDFRSSLPADLREFVMQTNGNVATYMHSQPRLFPDLLLENYRQEILAGQEALPAFSRAFLTALPPLFENLVNGLNGPEPLLAFKAGAIIEGQVGIAIIVQQLELTLRTGKEQQLRRDVFETHFGAKGNFDLETDSISRCPYKPFSVMLFAQAQRALFELGLAGYAKDNPAKKAAVAAQLESLEQQLLVALPEIINQQLKALGIEV